MDCKELEGRDFFFFMAVSLLQVQLGVKLPQKLTECLAFH